VLFLESMTSIPSLFHAIDASDDEDSLHSCLAAGSECCHCASASRLGFLDHDCLAAGSDCCRCALDSML
jgi:hypothetical protein